MSVERTSGGAVGDTILVGSLIVVSTMIGFGPLAYALLTGQGFVGIMAALIWVVLMYGSFE